MRQKLILIGLFIGVYLPQLHAQKAGSTAPNDKKILDHTIYDAWQSIGKIQVSNDGKWVAYTVEVQEGDGNLIVQASNNTTKYEMPRGYDAVFTGDSKRIIYKLKAPFKDLRQARIKKKKPEELPKDSLAIFTLANGKLQKQANLVSFKTPKEPNQWVAVLLKNEAAPKKSYQADKTKDSLKQVIDSLQYLLQSTRAPKPGDKDSVTDQGKANRLLLINTQTGTTQVFANTSDYLFNKKGTQLLAVQTLNLNDTAASARIIVYHLNTQKTDTVLSGGNDFKNLAISDDGTRVAFAAVRNAKPKAPKQYKLWYFRQGIDTATLLVDSLTPNMPRGYSVSEFGKIYFSRSGQRLVFATAPVKPPKDTSIADIDKVNVDIWHYKDDYLQTYQLENQKKDREKSYQAVYDLGQHKMMQLASPYLPNIYEGALADAMRFIAVTDTGRRVASQWTGGTLKDIYSIDVATGKYIPATLNINGELRPSWVSPSGRYILWYDHTTRHYHTFNGSSARNITQSIKVPLYDEENDVPDHPAPYGIMGWEDGDKKVLIYDRYDIWSVDPTGQSAPVNLTGNGRKNQVTYRYIQTDMDEDYIHSGKKNILRAFNNTRKTSSIRILENQKLISQVFNSHNFHEQPHHFDQFAQAKNAPVYAYSRESYTRSPNVYVLQQSKEQQLSATNPQQQNYNWGTASLYYWTTFAGKPATGIIYKPENFDSTKKYPVILYFYEKLSDNLYKYVPPAPTPSRLNISFFVSRGYIVMTPDISYTIGHPANSAYDYIVSGAQDLARHHWIDPKRMGIQGQSWGGIQVAQLITMTDMFAAAWAGAPVANMTSAYGGIRWSSGINRQFQYEKTQSRIGATLWEKPDLYIENSPLFHLPKANTPLVIMANDDDGAVPWYQGIELFTGMRRLGKQVWMLNYNGEEHNLIQRKNRKDIQIREQQFFDWLLKGERPARWITEGVPAVDKGNTWGLDH